MCFFFSSRRRHTRYWRDWSSDVCSSDLVYYSRFTFFTMKVLMIGDVVARPGRTAVLERVQDLREQHAVSLCVMNAENVSGGFSITPHHAEQLFAAGVDVMTSGNHIFDKREIVPYIEIGRAHV